MPILAIGIWNNVLQASIKQHGFTFIELVVVIAILAIIVTMVTINLGDPQIKRMSQARDQITSLVQLASEQAIFNSRDYGISVSTSGYAFLLLTQDGWVPVNDDRLFRNRTLPAGLEFDLFLDGLRVNLDREIQTVQNDEEAKGPQIFITSDGEISPFLLELTDRDDTTLRIRLGENGEFELETIDA